MLGSIGKTIFQGCLILGCIFLLISGLGLYHVHRMHQLMYADLCSSNLGYIADAKDQLKSVRDPNRLDEPVTWSDLLEETDMAKDFIPTPPYGCPSTHDEYFLGKLNEHPRCTRKDHNERYMELAQEWEAERMKEHKPNLFDVLAPADPASLQWLKEYNAKFARRVTPKPEPMTQERKAGAKETAE